MGNLSTKLEEEKMEYDGLEIELIPISRKAIEILTDCHTIYPDEMFPEDFLSQKLDTDEMKPYLSI